MCLHTCNLRRLNPWKTFTLISLKEDPASQVINSTTMSHDLQSFEYFQLRFPKI